jgi:hypothetical protein
MGLCALVAASCAKPSAHIEGTLTDAPGKQVTVKLLDVNKKAFALGRAAVEV